VSKKDETRREILADKFPQMDQKFKEVEKEVFEPQIERLGKTSKEQKQRSKQPG
jgi:hypothetical protein